MSRRAVYEDDELFEPDLLDCELLWEDLSEVDEEPVEPVLSKSSLYSSF